MGPRRAATIRTQCREMGPDGSSGVWMLSAPASSPFLDRHLRSRMIGSPTSWPTARGLLHGPLDRGWNGPSPSASNRLTSWGTQ
jgi:hypothetical protein